MKFVILTQDSCFVWKIYVLVVKRYCTNTHHLLNSKTYKKKQEHLYYEIVSLEDFMIIYLIIKLLLFEHVQDLRFHEILNMCE